MQKPADLALTLQSFFTKRLIAQRRVSPHTIASYRDTFRLLLQFSQKQLHKEPFQLGLAVVLLMLVVILSLFTSTFLTTGNILNILRQAAPTLIVAVAMTLVITSGGIDLSVGSSLALASVLAATMLSTGGPWWLVVVAVLVFGCAVGLINGLLVTLGGLPPFIATLATLSVLRGVAQIITKGYSIPVPPNSPFIEIGRGFLLGIPYPIVIAALAILIGHLLFNYTQFGIYITGIGSSE